MSRNLDAASRPLETRPDRRPRRRRGTSQLRDRIPRIEFLESRIVLSTDTWTGLGATNLWQDGGNWLGGSAPQANDDLVFPQMIGTAPFVAVDNFGAGTTFNSIAIEGSGYALFGQQIDLTTGITATGYTGSSSDNLNTVLGGGTITVATGATLNMGAGISGTAGLTLTGGGTLGMTGATANSYTGVTAVNAGTLLLDKTDPNSGSSTAIPGDLTISGGTVSLAATDQIVSTSTVTVSGTNTLQMNGNADTIGTLILENASLDTGGATLTLTGGLSNDSSTTQTSLAGNLALTAGTHQFTIADPSTSPDVNISAAISGPGGFTKMGTGSLALSGAETFGGPLEIASGIVTPSAAASFTSGIAVDSGGELDLGGGVTISVAVTAAGTGAVGGNGGAIAGTAGSNTLSGPITLSGATTIAASGGTLTVSGAIGDGGGGPALTLGGGGTFALSGVNTYTGATTISDGIVSITSDTPLDSTSGITIDSGGELDLNGVTLATPFTSVTGSGAVGGNGGAIVSTGAASTLSGSISLSGAATFDASSGLTISGVIGGTGSLITAGAQPLSLTNTNTYSGGTTISAGTTLAASASGALGTSTVTDDGELDLSNSITLSNALTLSSTASAIVNESGTSGLNGPVTLGLDTTIDVASGSTLNFFGAIGDGSPSNGYGVTETGGGLMVYASTTANTYTGDTTVNSGTLELDEQRGGLAIAGNLNIGDGTDTAEVLDWQNNQIDPGAYVTLNGANASLNLNGLNDTVAVLTFNGGSVTTGAGTLTLARNVFSNGTSPGSTATISGNLSLASSFNHVFSVYSNNAPNGIDLDISAVITGDATTGITKSGDGTLALDADNSTTFAGTTTVQVGTLDVTKSGALGGGAVAVDGTSALQLDGTGGNITLANSLTLDSSANELVSLAGSNTLSGPITLDAGAGVDVESGSTLTISGAIGQSGGTFGVTKIAGGTLVYAASSANSYTGTTNVNLGELDFNSTAANGAIAGPLVIGTNIFGSGTVKYLASSQVPSTTDVTVNNSSTLNLGGFSDTINDLTVTSGLVSLPAGSSLTAAGLTMTGGDINTGTGSTFTLSGNATIDDSPGGSTIDGTGSLVLGGTPSTFTVNTTTPAIGLGISVPISGTGGLTMTGGGTMQLSAPSANTYTGTTTVDDGTLKLNSTNNVAQIPGDLTVGDGTDTALVQQENLDQIASTSNVTVEASGTLDFNGFNDTVGSLNVLGGSATIGAASVNVAGTLAFTGGSVSTSPTGNLILGGNVTTSASSNTATISGNMDLGGATRTFTLASGAADPDLTISANISGTGAGIVEAGSGNLKLSGDNTYDGMTEIQSGVLTAASASALGSTASGTQVDSGGTLALIGNTTIPVGEGLSLDGLGYSGVGALWGPLSGESNTYAGPITLAGAANIGAGDGSTLTISGVVDDGSHGYAVTINNTYSDGTVVFSGANTYAGTTTVNVGTLEITNDHALSSNSTGATVDSGATLELAGGITIPSNNALIVHGSAVAGADKIVNVSGTNTIDGSITLQNDEHIDVSAGSQLNIDGNVGGGSYVIFKDGAGTLELGGTNPLVGAFINSGSLLVNGSSPLSINGAVIYSGATLGGTGTVGNVTVNSGGTVAPGDAPGTLNTGGVSFTGGSSYNVELDGTTAGSGYDQLSATGTVALGNATLGVSLGLGYTPNVGDVYDIVATQGGGTISGTFDWNGQTLSDGSTLTVGNTVFQIAYNGSSGPITLTALWHIDTWTGGDIATSNGWSDGLNWQGGAVPAAGDALVFPAGLAAATNNDFAANTDFHSITIGDSGYTFTGNAIKLDAGITASYASGSLDFPINVALNADQTFDLTGGTLTFSGILSGTGALTETGAGTLDLSNSFNAYGGTTVDAGTLLITGASLGSGSVTVNGQSSLQFSYPSGGMNLSNPLTLDSSSPDALENLGGGNSLNGSITLGVNTTIAVSGGELVLGGPMTGAGFALTEAGPGLLLVNGTITNSSGLTVSSGTLGGGGTAPGLTVQSGATVQPGEAQSTAVLSANNSVAFDSGSTYGVWLGGANVGQYDQLNVTGTVDLNPDSSTGANLRVSLVNGYVPKPGTTYTIITSSGALSNTFNGLADAATVMAGSYSFRINYQAGAVTLTALPRVDTWTGGAATGNWGDAANWDDNVVPAQYDALIFPSNTSPAALTNNLTAGTELTSIEIDAAGLGFSGNAILLDNGITTGYSTGASSFAIDTGINSNEFFNIGTGGLLDITGVISGGGSLSTTGGGTLRLDAANTYTGGTTVGGLLEVTNADALGNNGGATVTVDNGGELLASGNFTLAPTSLTIYGSGVSGAGAMVLDSGASAGPTSFDLGSSASIGVTNGSSSIGTAIGDGGNGYGVTIGGGGTLTLSAASSYTGTTDVTAGTLVLDDTTGSALAGPLTIDASGSGSAIVQDFASNQLTAATADVTMIGSGATFDLHNNSDSAHSLTFTGGSVTTGSGTLTLGAGGVTTNTAATTAMISGNLDLGGATQTFAVESGTQDPSGLDLSISAIVSNGGITTTDAGTLALSGANTYAGGTSITAGALLISEPFALGTGAATVSGSASLQVTYPSGGMTVSNPLTLDSSSAAAVESIAGSVILSGAITLGQSTSVDASSGSQLAFSGDVGDGSPSNHYSLTSVGTGDFSLSGTNTYTGGTTAVAGGFGVGSAAATGSVGAVTVDSDVTLSIGAPTYNLPSGGLTLDTGASVLVNTGTAETINGGITLAGNVGINTGLTSSLTVSGAITGGYGVTTSGTVILTGTSSYTGATTISGGTLEVDGSIATSSEVDVDAGAILGGSGTVGNVVSTGGTVAPADAPNILHTGSFSLDSNSTYTVQLDGTSAGGVNGYDQVIASGAVSLGGATLSATLGGSYTPTLGDQLTIIKNNSGSAVVGNFSGLPDGAVLTFGAYHFQISYQGGLSGQDVVLTAKAAPTTTVTAAPNPSQFGQSVTFSVTVTGGGPTPTGTVTFYDGDPNSGGQQIGMPQTLSSGQASVPTTSLSVGTHQIYASYSGDGYYFSNTGQLVGGQDVTTDVTTTSVSSAQASATYGSNVILTALVTAAFGGTPTGTVEFFDGMTDIGPGTLNSIGVATLATTALTVTGSPHVITADYAANSTFQASNSATYSQTITPALLTITADSTSKTYGQALTFAGTEFTTSTLYNGDAVTFVSLSSPGAPATASVAAPYTISAAAALGTGLGNYTISYATGQLTVNPAPLTVTADSTSKTYGDTTTFAGTEFATSTLYNGDSVTSVSLSSPGAAATAGVAGSPYAINASAALGTGLANYTITYTPGQLTVNPAALTITADSTGKTYGGTTTFAGTEFTTSTLYNGDSVNLVSLSSAGAAATAGVAGSPYAISVSGALGSGLGNYTISYATGQLTVNAAPLTITANSTSKTYGDTTTFAGTEFTTTTLYNGDSVASVSLTSAGAAATAGVAGSPYTIAPSNAAGSGLGNYTISYATGQLTVNAAPLTITANSTSKTYGDTTTFAGTEFTTSILYNGDSVTSVSLTSPGAAATAGAAGSPYVINAGAAAGTGLGNYTITYVTGQLTVNRAALTITANGASKTYGTTASFAGTEFTTAGLLNSDAVNLVTLSSPGAAATAGVVGSPYAITPSNAAGSGLGNYNITYANGHLTVTPASLTITANSTGKTYGGTLTFAGTEFSEVGLVNGDTVTSVSLSSPGAAATAGVAGSPYVINAGNAAGSGLGNYTISYTPGQLNVAPAPLSITANDQSRAYGALNPAFTATYSGFVNGDTPASFTTPLILSTTASAVSPVGAYSIAASGASSTNYAITFRAGTLAVAQASSSTTIATPSAASAFGQAVSFTVQVGPGPNLATGAVKFVIDGTIAASVPIDPSTGLATWTTTSLGLGSHTITAGYTGDTNVQPSLSGSIQEVVTQASSQSGVTGQAVRNSRGQIVAVNLDASVLALSPGSGLPSGPVTFFQGKRKLGKATLSGGMAVLRVKAGLVLNRAVTVQYAGSAEFGSSASPKVFINKNSLTAARPFAAFHTKSHGPLAKSAVRTMSRHASHGRGR